MTTTDLKYSELTEQLIGIYFEIYRDLGYGFLEHIYEKAFVMLLEERSIHFQQQVPLRVTFRGTELGEFRADLIVESVVIVELKAVQKIDLAHEKQILNYLKATNVEVGLIFNFGPSAQFRRIVFENQRKASARAAGT